MNKRHKAALRNPVSSLDDMMNPELFQVNQIGGLLIKSILTVHVGDEDGPTWHASGSILDSNRQPIRLIGNTAKEDFDKLFDYVHSLIKNVGTGETSTIEPDAVFHLFKKLSPSELTLLKKHSRGH